MGRLSLKIFTIFLLFSLLVKGEVKNLYVDPVNGDDSNNGEEEHPYKTISAAVSVVTEDEDLQLYLFPGTYQGSKNKNVLFPGNSYIEFYVTTTGPSNQYVIVDCQNEVDSIAFIGNKSLTIDSSNGHLRIQNCAKAIKMELAANFAPLQEYNYQFSALTIEFTNCTTAIYLNWIDNVSITNCTFTSNAQGNTLDIANIDDKILIFTSYFFGSEGRISIRDTNYTTFDTCYSNQGFMITSSNEVSSYNKFTSTIIENTCGSDDIHYALDLSGSQFVLEATSIINNQCGGINFQESEFNLKGCTFYNNLFVSGGALALYYSNGTISQSSNFTNNIATLYGGAIYLASSNVSIVDTSFTNNQASSGAVIYCDPEFSGESSVDYSAEDVILVSNVNSNTNGTDIDCFDIEYISSIPEDEYIDTPGAGLGLEDVFWIIFIIVMAIIIVIGVGGGIVAFFYRRRRAGYYNVPDY